MADFFFRNTRLLILAICLILVAGLSSYFVLPRMEDPALTQRIAIVNTIFPGADASRVENLVTDKLEKELQEVEEIKELRSISRTGISAITIELRDDVYDVGPVWSRVRDKLDDAKPKLPKKGVSDPEFEEIEMKAYALIVALNWTLDDQPNYAILRRHAEHLEDNLRGLSGTEEIDTFGDPKEEITIEIDPAKIAALNLTAAQISKQIQESDSKVAAGQLRGRANDLLLEIEGELESLERIEQIPIHYGEEGEHFVLVADIAKVTKGYRTPPDSLAIIDGKPAVVLGVFVRPEFRVDLWTQKATSALKEFSDNLPPGIELVTVFEQNQYVQTRLEDLLLNLLLGGLAVVGVIFLMMGWRSALLVGLALPLSALMVLTGMRFLNIPIHQMSVTGLIIALGLLIDNAIVIVDEVTGRLREGLSPAEAVSKSVRHLAVPLFGSTLTTALAFAPIALMPGPAGEFVGSIAISVILAIASSFLLAMTVIPALTAISNRFSRQTNTTRWYRDGFSNPDLAKGYRWTLTNFFRRPISGVVLGVILPILGFYVSSSLPEQFFPPADRDQFQIEIDLPSQASLQETMETVKKIRKIAMDYEEVENVHWVVGESAPSFYYNVVPKRKNISPYAQALVQLKSKEGSKKVIHRLQGELDRQFPGDRILVRQLEQGPPFDAPVEVRLYGPDIQVLQKLGEEVRILLSEIPDVVHSRSEMSETLPKVSLQVVEEETRLIGLDHTALARQLEGSLEGSVGGSILEETEELPVRVRVGEGKRSTLEGITSLDIQPKGIQSQNGFDGVPLSSLVEVKLKPEVTSITRLDNRRLNEVQAFIKAGVLPAKVLESFKEKLKQSNFQLPPGYELNYGGETAERNTAVSNLMANVGILLVLMVATLVLSFGSFRIAGIIGLVAALSAGLAMGALWVFGYPFGFMAIVGTMGLMGVAINDAIVVMAAIREDEKAKQGDPEGVTEVIIHSTRHVVSTSLTTIAGFLPLVLGGGGFWPPLAVAIAGGVGGATILALFFVPSVYILLMCRGCKEKMKEILPLKQTASSHVWKSREIVGVH